MKLLTSQAIVPQALSGRLSTSYANWGNSMWCAILVESGAPGLLQGTLWFACLVCSSATLIIMMCMMMQWRSCVHIQELHDHGDMGAERDIIEVASSPEPTCTASSPFLPTPPRRRRRGRCADCMRGGACTCCAPSTERGVCVYNRNLAHHCAYSCILRASACRPTRRASKKLRKETAETFRCMYEDDVILGGV